MSNSDRKMVETQVEAYYRAIGRILAHCMLKSIVVATHVLPELYKTGMFADVLFVVLVLLVGVGVRTETRPFLPLLHFLCFC